MTCVAKNGHFWLFDKDGKPEVLKRFYSEKTDSPQAACLVEERGDLDGKHLTDRARKVLTAAWKEWVAWKSVNQ